MSVADADERSNVQKMQSPLAPSGYQFFRNVLDFGAKGDGVTDDTVAINQAVASFSLSDRDTLRCGQTCGSTTTLGALVYFPVRTEPLLPFGSRLANFWAQSATARSQARMS